MQLRTQVQITVALGAALLSWAQAPSSPGAEPYRISSGDLLDVRLDFNPDMNFQVFVRPDGAISVSMVGELQAAGKTAVELGQEIERGMAKSLRNPQVTVSVREFAGQRVFVGGEVATPRAVDLRGPLTCLQALYSVGGPRPSAKLDQVVLVRYTGEGQAVIQRVNLKQISQGKIPDVMLKPYDLVLVPKTRIAKVTQFVESYVNANVPRALVFPYNLNTSLTYNVQ